MKIIRLLILLLLPFVASAQKNVWETEFLNTNHELPIKKKRTISFNTDEASYMDVDVSPDGKNILFNILGEIFILPSSGGNARQLTRGLGVKSRPIWSPDGTKFSCLTDENGGMAMLILDKNGRRLNMINLVGMQYPRFGVSWRYEYFWYPDSRSVYIKSLGNIDVNTGKITGFSGYLEKDDKVIKVFADGYYVWRINSGLLGFSKFGGADTIALKNLPEFNLFSMQSIPLVSSDRKWLIYPSFYIKGRYNEPGTIIKILNMSTGEEKTLVDTKSKALVWRFSEHMSFSPDSKYVYLGYGGKIHKVSISGTTDEVIPFNTSVKVDLGPLVRHRHELSLDSLNVRFIRDVQKSSDGKSLVFSALDRVYTMDYPNGIPCKLGEDEGGKSFPSFSPDGKWISYISHQDGRGYLWKVATSGGMAVKLTQEEGSYSFPRWSANGENLTFVADTGRFGNELRLLNLKTMKIAHVPVKDKISMPPTFSLDSGRLFIGTGIRMSEERNAFQKIDLKSGGNEKIALELSGGSDQMERLEISPDEKYILFQRGDGLYLFERNSGVETIVDEKVKTRAVRFAAGGFDPLWIEGGKKISWSYGNRYLEISLSTILSALSEQNPDYLPGKWYKEIEVKPDVDLKINLHAGRMKGTGTIALVHAKILTMEGDKIFNTATIIVKDGRIINLGENIKVPEGAVVVDCTGKTVMPGLIDVHNHTKFLGRPFRKNWQTLSDLSYGVTTAVDPSADNNHFGMAELIETGQMTGPRLFTSGKPIVFDVGIYNLNDAEKFVADRKAFGWPVMKQYLQNSRLKPQWLLMASDKAGVNMTNESGMHDVCKTLAQIKDGSSGSEHQFGFWYDAYKDMKYLYAKSGTWITPTLATAPASYNGRDGGTHYFSGTHNYKGDAKIKYFAPDEDLRAREAIYGTVSKIPEFLPLAKADAEIAAMGGLITTGSHGNSPGLGMHFEMQGMQMGGMDNLNILKLATINGAVALGLDESIGSIKKGKIADLVILDADPLEDIKNTTKVFQVMKAGVLYDGKTLDMKWPLEKKMDWKPGQQNDVRTIRGFGYPAADHEHH